MQLVTGYLHNEEIQDIFITKFYLADQVKRDVVGVASGKFVGGEKVQKFVWGSKVNRSLGLDGKSKIYLKSSDYSGYVNILD